MQKLKLAQLGRLTNEEIISTKKNNIIIVADNIRSAMNIGSLFRTADAFLVEEIILLGISAQPPNREIQKTALGATATVAWKYFENIQDGIEYLNEKKYEIVCIEQSKESTFLQNFSVNKDKNYALVLGNEVDGVSQEMMNKCHACIEIAQYGTKHSLNVSVCAGIVVWYFTKK